MSFADRLYFTVELFINAMTTSSLTPDWASLTTSAPGPEIGIPVPAGPFAAIPASEVIAEPPAGAVAGPLFVWAEADKIDAAATAQPIAATGLKTVTLILD